MDASDFDFPKLSNEPLPDIPSLLRALQANEEKVEKLLDTYSYVQRSTSRELGNDGVLRDKESSTYQLSFLQGLPDQTSDRKRREAFVGS